MNLMLSAKRPRQLPNTWLVACYASLLPFGFLLFHDGWYGIGWGRLAGPLILVGTIVGSVCSGVVLWYGNWWRKLVVVPTVIPFAAIVWLIVSQFIVRLIDLF